MQEFCGHFYKILIVCTDKIVLDLVNQYWPVMYQEMLPETKEVWEPMMIAETNAILLRIPFRQMLYYGNEKEKKSEQ